VVDAAFIEKRYEKIDPIHGEVKGFATPTGKVELYSTILENSVTTHFPVSENFLKRLSVTPS
jgi:hypothetical protein